MAHWYKTELSGLMIVDGEATAMIGWNVDQKYK